MVIAHIASFDPELLGGVPVAVPQMVRAQSCHGQVCLVNLQGSTQIFSNGEVIEKALEPPFDKPDLVVFHEVYKPAFLKIARKLKGQGIPYIVIPHGCLSRQAQKRKWLKKKAANLLLFDRFLKNARAIQYLSENEAKATVFSHESFVSGNGVPIPDERSMPKGDGITRFVYIGRLEIEIKGLDLLLTAVAGLSSLLRENRCRIDIFGPDSEGAHEYLRSTAQQLQIEDLVCVSGPVTGEEKHRVLKCADWFIQPSRSEGMPMGVLEALSLGIPCIVTEGTGLADLIREHDAGFGCETGAVTIAGAILQAVTQNQLRSAKAEAAALLAARHFDCRRIAAEAVAHYEKICE